MWTKKLSSALNLTEHEQDWGICNADSRRILEFIKFYQSNQVSYLGEQEALAELIFESMNDAIQHSEVDSILLEEFCSFLKLHKAEFPQQLQYWKSLAEKGSAFPVAKIIMEMTT